MKRPRMVRKIHGTKRLWYEKSGNHLVGLFIITQMTAPFLSC